MIKSIILLLLFSINVYSYDGPKFYDVTDLYIELNNDNSIYDTGVLVGANLTENTEKEDLERDADLVDKLLNDVTSKVKAFLVLESDEAELLRIPIFIATAHFGLEMGTAKVFNKRMSVSNFSGKYISEVLGEYAGRRHGVSTLLGGVGYSSLENDHNVKIKDWDFRMIPKLDLYTFLAMVLEVDESQGDIYLDDIYLREVEGN